jgi:hypothetical protein
MRTVAVSTVLGYDTAIAGARQCFALVQHVFREADIAMQLARKLPVRDIPSHPWYGIIITFHEMVWYTSLVWYTALLSMSRLYHIL